MEKFVELEGMVAPLDRANVDTDAIIPSRFLKSIKRTGFGANLFGDWRPDPSFVLNAPRYRGAQILLARENFGCGSSREHAAWALLDYGFRAVIAPSYGDIFTANSLKNGLLAVVLSATEVDELFRAAQAAPRLRLRIDLRQQSVAAPGGRAFAFAMDPGDKHRLEHGLDDIALVLRHAEWIRDYEAGRRASEPWIFDAH
jgi:3-isopropylmalate/(R)-2-methylmalate dehydratase small subunit